MADTLPDADTCEEIFHAAITAGDAKGVEAALMLMAVQDPDRAARLLETIRLALLIDKINKIGAGSENTNG
jgi:hypothetical protein